MELTENEINAAFDRAADAWLADRKPGTLGLWQAHEMGITVTDWEPGEIAPSRR